MSRKDDLDSVPRKLAASESAGRGAWQTKAEKAESKLANIQSIIREVSQVSRGKLDEFGYVWAVQEMARNWCDESAALERAVSDLAAVRTERDTDKQRQDLALRQLYRQYDEACRDRDAIAKERDAYRRSMLDFLPPHSAACCGFDLDGKSTSVTEATCRCSDRIKRAYRLLGVWYWREIDALRAQLADSLGSEREGKSDG